MNKNNPNGDVWCFCARPQFPDNSRQHRKWTFLSPMTPEGREVTPELERSRSGKETEDADTSLSFPSSPITRGVCRPEARGTLGRPRHSWFLFCFFCYVRFHANCSLSIGPAVTSCDTMVSSDGRRSETQPGLRSLSVLQLILELKCWTRLEQKREEEGPDALI